MKDFSGFGSEAKLKDPVHIGRDLLHTMSLTSTSKGILKKYTFEDGGTIFYVKAGQETSVGVFSSTLPVCEVIASEIGSVLGFSVAHNHLGIAPAGSFESNTDVLVSISTSVLLPGEDLIPFAELLGNSELNNKTDLYELISAGFPRFRQDVDRMILFDFLIDNPDRHLNNFGVITGHGRVPNFSPLFDNGQGFLGQYQEYELPKGDDMVYKGKSLPFRKTQKKSFSLLKDVTSLGIKWVDNPESLLPVFDKYGDYLTTKRLASMKEMFVRRYNYVRSKI